MGRDPQEFPIAITGMHRSGTSMITRALHDSGLHLIGSGAEELIDAAEDNPEGFWENKAIVACNDALLEATGGSWDNPPALAPQAVDDPRVVDLAESTTAALTALSEHEPWGFKDPRTCLTAGYWLDLEPELKFIICVRHPLEVALSLKRRNQNSYSLGLALWERYYTSVLELVPPERRIVTHYDTFFVDPVGEVERLCAFAGLEAVPPRVRSDLRHHTVAVGLGDAGVSPNLRALYSSLCRESGAPVVPEPPADEGRVRRLILDGAVAVRHAEQRQAAIERLQEREEQFRRRARRGACESRSLRAERAAMEADYRRAAPRSGAQARGGADRVGAPARGVPGQDARAAQCDRRFDEADVVEGGDDRRPDPRDGRPTRDGRPRGRTRSVPPRRAPSRWQGEARMGAEHCAKAGATPAPSLAASTRRLPLRAQQQLRRAAASRPAGRGGARSDREAVGQRLAPECRLHCAAPARSRLPPPAQRVLKTTWIRLRLARTAPIPTAKRAARRLPPPRARRRAARVATQRRHAPLRRHPGGAARREVEAGADPQGSRAAAVEGRVRAHGRGGAARRRVLAGRRPGEPARGARRPPAPCRPRSPPTARAARSSTTSRTSRTSRRCATPGIGTSCSRRGHGPGSGSRRSSARTSSGPTGRWSTSRVPVRSSTSASPRSSGCARCGVRSCASRVARRTARRCSTGPNAGSPTSCPDSRRSARPRVTGSRTSTAAWTSSSWTRTHDLEEAGRVALLGVITVSEDGAARAARDRSRERGRRDRVQLAPPRVVVWSSAVSSDDHLGDGARRARGRGRRNAAHRSDRRGRASRVFAEHDVAVVVEPARAPPARGDRGRRGARARHGRTPSWPARCCAPTDGSIPRAARCSRTDPSALIADGSEHPSAPWHDYRRAVCWAPGSGRRARAALGRRFGPDGLGGRAFLREWCAGVWASGGSVDYQPTVAAVRVGGNGGEPSAPLRESAWQRVLDLRPSRPDELSDGVWRYLIAHDDVEACRP